MRAHLLKPLPVRCTTIVATREGFPRDYQELEPVERRNIVSAVYTTVMLVEIEARVAIDSGKPRLWALVRFMKHTWEQLVEVARRFRADTEDERWWFWRAMGMKYDRSVNRLSEEVHMSDAVMDKLFQDLLPYSPYRRDKWTEALAKEAILEALRMLRKFVDRRFPALRVPEAVAPGVTLDLVHDAADAFMMAESEDQARAALLRLEA